MSQNTRSRNRRRVPLICPIPSGRVVREITRDRVKVRIKDPKTGVESMRKPTDNRPTAEDLRVLDEMFK